MNEAASKLFGEESLSTIELQYFDMVDRLCESREHLMLSNGSSRHAVYLIYKFLTNAQHVVRLLSERLLRRDGDVLVFANPVLTEAALTFLRKPGTQLQILVEGELDVDEGSGENPFLGRLRQEEGLQGKLDVRTLPDSPYEMNWMTMDASAYRLEPEPTEIRAHADFRDEEFVDVLNALFDDAFEDAEPIAA